MLTVYPESIIYLFAPLVGMADEGMGVDRALNPAIVSEETVKQIYECEVKPYFLCLDPRLQTVCKHALAHLINADNVNFANEFHSMLLPFRCPDEPKDAFVWLWDVLFPNEEPSPLLGLFNVDYRGDVAQYVLRDALQNDGSC